MSATTRGALRRPAPTGMPASSSSTSSGFTSSSSCARSASAHIAHASTHWPAGVRPSGRWARSWTTRARSTPPPSTSTGPAAVPASCLPSSPTTRSFTPGTWPAAGRRARSPGGGPVRAGLHRRPPSDNPAPDLRPVRRGGGGLPGRAGTGPAARAARSRSRLATRQPRAVGVGATRGCRHLLQRRRRGLRLAPRWHQPTSSSESPTTVRSVASCWPTPSRTSMPARGAPTGSCGSKRPSRSNRGSSSTPSWSRGSCVIWASAAFLVPRRAPST